MSDFATTILRLCRAGNDLTIRQAGLAILLHQNRDTPEQRQTKSLAAQIGGPRSMITRGADMLEGQGYARRSQLPGDRRSCVLTLTTEGEKFVRELVG